MLAAPSRLDRTRAAALRARRAGHVPQPMPAQRPPTRIEETYAYKLKARVSRAIRRAYAPLLRDLPGLVEAARSERGDAADWRADGTNSHRSASAAIKSAQQAMAADLRDPGLRKDASLAASDVSAHNRGQLGAQVKAVLGINLAGDAALAPTIAGFVHENVKLITNITPKLAADIEAVVLQALTTGQVHEDLARLIEQRFGIAENRAALIAVDQVGKLNGQVNIQRMRDLGVTEFEWQTVEDERVRGNPSGKYPNAVPSHYDRNGKRYRLDDPPKGKNGEPEYPGTPINCRCGAVPVLAAVLGEQAPAGAEGPVQSPDDLEAQALELQRQVEAMLASQQPAGMSDFAAVLAAARGQPQPDPASSRFPSPPTAFPEPPPLVGDPVPAGEREQALRHGSVVSIATNPSAGVSESMIVTLDHEGKALRAFFKPSEGEVGGNNIPQGLQFVREVAASAAAPHLGVADLVPATAARSIPPHGMGSIQAAVEGAITTQALTPSDWEKLDRDAAVRMRVFDFVIGNGDRHGANVLWTRDPDGTIKPALIDHGLTFPSGPARYFFQPPAGVDLDLLPLTDGARAVIDALDPVALAADLAKQGLDELAIGHTLYRAAMLQIDRNLLSPRPGEPGYRALGRWQEASANASRRLSLKDRRALDKIAGEAIKGRR